MGLVVARINVADDIESRLEYKKLVKILNGNHNEALGMLVQFWRIAQKHWGKGELVPNDVISDFDFQPLIESKWAIPKDNGVYAIGSEVHFDWYKQLVEGAKKGGRTRSKSERDEFGQFAKKDQPSTSPSLENIQPITTPTPASSSPLTLSLVLAPALTTKKEELKAKKQKEKETENQVFAKALDQAIDQASTELAQVEFGLAPVTPDSRHPVSRFIGTYVKAFQKRYGENTRPAITGKTQGEIKSFLKHTPIERAINLIEVYLQMEEKLFIAKHHDFTTFVYNLNTVSVALDTGNQASGINWNKVFGEDFKS